MLRKISASEPVFGVIAKVCVEAPQISPDSGEVDPPAESYELPNDAVLPRPPIIVIKSDPGGGWISASPTPAPICPTPTLKTAFDPLTGTTKQYYDFGAGLTAIPAQCQIGAGVFF